MRNCRCVLSKLVLAILKDWSMGWKMLDSSRVSRVALKDARGSVVSLPPPGMDSLEDGRVMAYLNL